VSQFKLTFQPAKPSLINDFLVPQSGNFFYCDSEAPGKTNRELAESVFTLTFVVGAPPSTDETVADVKHELIAHIMRSADGLNVVRKVEGRAEQHQRYIVVRCGFIIVLMHFNFTDGTKLGMSFRSGQLTWSCHDTKIVFADPSEHITEPVWFTAVATLDPIAHET